jgi:formyltetrahydrofolate synthetase
MHGGGPPKVADPVYKTEGLDLLRKGVCNLQHHVKSCKKYGIKVWSSPCSEGLVKRGRGTIVL